MNLIIENSKPGVRNFVSEMENEAILRTSSRFWNDLFQALTYSDDLGSVFGPSYTSVTWTLLNELDEWKEHLLRYGVEWQNPEKTYEELCQIRQRVARFASPQTTASL